ncbi:anti-sigma factor family protein [Microbacterium sp.]|uniref:anti-sigma factor family protein n=1 Tax=Microbacterium sp. TaxID=51671 RepID=UPI00281286A8|nr:zf-HC2 domain-containing protein [Microbacterium sp.]
MTDDHARFAQWDAAYVLGALSAADRVRYEAHLAQCDRCRTAIAELAPIPGLLSRVPADRLDEAAAPVGAAPDPARRADIIRIGRARARRSRRMRRIAALGVAAAVIAAVLIVPVMRSLSPDDSLTVALEPVADRPLSASVRLEDVAWGTRIDMTCRYEDAADAPADGWTYLLVVVGEDGSETTLSSWRAFPESTATVSAGTALRADEIDRLEVRAARTGDVLLSGDPEDSAPR